MTSGNRMPMVLVGQVRRVVMAQSRALARGGLPSIEVQAADPNIH